MNENSSQLSRRLSLNESSRLSPMCFCIISSHSLTLNRLFAQRSPMSTINCWCSACAANCQAQRPVRTCWKKRSSHFWKIFKASVCVFAVNGRRSDGGKWTWMIIFWTIFWTNTSRYGQKRRPGIIRRLFSPSARPPLHLTRIFLTTIYCCSYQTS